MRLVEGYNGKMVDMALKKTRRFVRNTVFSRMGVLRCRTPKRKDTNCR